MIGPGYHPLQRSYVKNLEVQDIAAGAGVYTRIRAVMGEGQADRAEFRRLAGLLFLELVAEDSAFDPSAARGRRGETQKQHRRGSPQGPCSGAVADREALRGTLGKTAPVGARTEPTGGTKGA